MFNGTPATNIHGHLSNRLKYIPILHIKHISLVPLPPEVQGSSWVAQSRGTGTSEVPQKVMAPGSRPTANKSNQRRGPRRD